MTLLIPESPSSPDGLFLWIKQGILRPLEALSDLGKINYHHDKYACPEHLRIALHDFLMHQKESLPKSDSCRLSKSNELHIITVITTLKAECKH